MKVFKMNASFGCKRKIILQSKQEVIDYLTAELGETDEEYFEIGDIISIEVAEITADELREIPEFDGC